MWLKQKVYTLAISGDLTSQDNIGNVNVKVNDKLTTIEIKQLFAKVDYSELSDDNKLLKICGWSILQRIENGVLKIGQNEVAISFENENGILLSVQKIANPWFQLNDIELSEEDYNSIDNKILELADNSSKETGVVEEPHSSPPVFINKDYESGAKAFIKKGFTEHSSGNFKLLINSEKDKVIFIEVINENEMTQYKKSSKVTEGFYSFDDVENKRSINVKLIGNEIEVTYSDDEAEQGEQKSNNVELTNN